MTTKTPIVLKKAIKQVLISVLVISGIPWMLFFAYTYLLYTRMQDPAYQIVAIVQSNHDQEPLKTGFLAELLDLSVDRPANLYRFDLEEGRKKLLRFPSIKTANMKKIPPGILFIEYSLRKPVAFLGDVSNILLDAEHHPFPAHPFFSPKKLPSIILGRAQERIVFGKPINDPKLTLAFEILDSIHALSLDDDLLQIDVSEVDALSLGMRKIIVSFLSLDVLLDPREFKEGLNRLKRLSSEQILAQKDHVAMIDLRLPNLGYIVIPSESRSIKHE